MMMDRHLIKRFALLGGLWVSTLASASNAPIGYLQADGQVSVQVAGAEAPLRIIEDEYTVFAGDRIFTDKGAAVLRIDGGGALGLAASSAASVDTASPSGEVRVELHRGRLLFNLPANSPAPKIELSDFVLRSHPIGSSVVRVRLRQPDDLIGMVEQLDSGHIQVSMSSGELQVVDRAGSVHRVSAGQRTGLLAIAGRSSQVARVMAQRGSQELIRIEAPESVGTNEEFRIRWDGQTGQAESFITIAPEGAQPEEFERVMSTTEGNVIAFEAPETPGDYEIRYVDGETGEVGSFVYLNVVGEPAAVPWIASNQALVTGVTLAAAGGGTVLLIRDDDDEGPTSVSP